MIHIQNSLNSQFIKLRLSIEKILELDFENDDSIEQLTKLQTEQSELREKIEQIDFRLNDNDYPHELIAIVQECMDLQVRANEKMNSYKLKLIRNIRQIENGHKARDGYRILPTQIDGYFIDKHN
ncbi:ABC-type phosphate transport system auxiliary subunit [Paenibacillus sp. V4I3]|uniref:hypothetical protein n=1 Tax=Paenibacillus sp. V4I3 TaxID=3042305 RepID=UPI00278523EF|nr:hypothetical protein [Paenibacillus sp. V4I3]MDQ0872141.1 ABC-type phosphate transport system auxiliary subunit [Paenibacillus sp. V4I3]